MIISTGWAKGMKVKAPSGSETRPTSAKVRAAALNMLSPRIQDAHFLDVFAGSGAMGIEALSRGAASCTFVESGRQALQCLQSNLTEVRRRAEAQSLPPPEVHVIGVDAGRMIARLPGTPLDVVFVDPPYRDVPAWVDNLLEPLAERCTSDAILILEHDNSDASMQRIAREVAGWCLDKQKTYGETVLSVFRRQYLSEGGM